MVHVCLVATTWLNMMSERLGKQKCSPRACVTLKQDFMSQLTAQWVLLHRVWESVIVLAFLSKDSKTVITTFWLLQEEVKTLILLTVLLRWVTIDSISHTNLEEHLCKRKVALTRWTCYTAQETCNWSPGLVFTTPTGTGNGRYEHRW